MAQGINKEIFLGYEQYLFVNGLPVPGAQSVQFSYNLPKQAVYPLGGVDSLITTKGFNNGRINIDASLISQDPFFYLTGNIGVNGFLIKDLNNKYDNFAFISGYLVNYSNQYSIGGLPQINASFEVYESVGLINSSYSPHINTEINSLSYTTTGIFQDIHQGCATITTSDFNDNPLLSYDINISCPKIPIYSIGQNVPRHVLLGKPIETTITLQFEDAVYQHFKMSDHPTTRSRRNITIGLHNKNNESVNRYVFGALELISVSRQTNVNTPNTVTLTYKKSS